MVNWITADRKSQKYLVGQWNAIAHIRLEQILSGKDLSFSYVLEPTIFNLASKSDFTSVLDVGCGTGILTKQLAQKAKNVIAIDMSKEMISIAKEQCKNLKNIHFYNSTLKRWTRNNTTDFSLVIANMSLMTMTELDSVIKNISEVLIDGGHFIFTVTHPCFWPIYSGYSDKNWFDYNREIFIEGPFKISLDSTRSSHKTIHIHRSIEQYLLSLSRAGLLVEQISEPRPNKEIEEKYPISWKYPRFLGIRCIKSVYVA
jgi:2-polyprenyl-3-methyl-5-hydroxy-6-metoxy-1,4-benzoquinol methylase